MIRTWHYDIIMIYIIDSYIRSISIFGETALCLRLALVVY